MFVMYLLIVQFCYIFCAHAHWLKHSQHLVYQSSLHIFVHSCQHRAQSAVEVDSQSSYTTHVITIAMIKMLVQCTATGLPLINITVCMEYFFLCAYWFVDDHMHCCLHITASEPNTVSLSSPVSLDLAPTPQPSRKWKA